MGLGDEIMALGRAEALFEKTGRQVAICNSLGHPREHQAWHENPAWNPAGPEKITDGGGCRPYLRGWDGNRAVFNLDYRPRAGRVFVPDPYRLHCPLKPPYAIVAPFLKKTASPNKSWGPARWEEAIRNFPLPVYQLLETPGQQLIEGAIPHHTPTFMHALAAIERAALVLCNEGGTHHMAASMQTPAVVVFGSFTPPEVTGYDFHHNLAVETPEGYCGRYSTCDHCQMAMAQITPAMVKEKAKLILEAL